MRLKSGQLSAISFQPEEGRAERMSDFKFPFPLLIADS